MLPNFDLRGVGLAKESESPLFLCHIRNLQWHAINAIALSAINNRTKGQGSWYKKIWGPTSVVLDI